MCDVLMTVDYKWLISLSVEIAVFVLIAYEVRHTVRGEREGKRKQAIVDSKVSELLKFVDEGKALVSNVPNPDVSGLGHPSMVQAALAEKTESEKAWMDSVRAWTEKTNSFLNTHSPRASTTFMLVGDAGNVDCIIQGPGRNSFVLRGAPREHYQRLVVQLKNLLGVVDKAESYF